MPVSPVWSTSCQLGRTVTFELGAVDSPAAAPASARPGAGGSTPGPPAFGARRPARPASVVLPAAGRGVFARATLAGENGRDGVEESGAVAGNGRSRGPPPSPGGRRRRRAAASGAAGHGELDAPERPVHAV